MNKHKNTFNPQRDEILGTIINIFPPFSSSKWSLLIILVVLLKSTGNIRHLAHAAGYDCLTCFSARRGNSFKYFLEDCVHALLNRMLTEPPPVWGANMIVVLKPK